MKVLGRATDGLRNRTAVVALISALAVFGVLIVDSQADPVEFNPTVSFTTSTTLAAAHPDAQITITNPGSEDLKGVTLDLPEGMWGSLAAVSAPCTWTNAAAGTCPATSKVGTIVADALIDDSDARLRGTVYLTDPNPASPFANNGPAWLSIVLPAKVGGVDFGKVITPARLELRHNQAGVPTNAAGPIYGPVNGIRTIVDDIPRTVTDDNSPRTLSFHVKKMQIDLRSNQTAPQLPLLTNPGKCSTTQLTTTMTSYDSATVQSPSANFTTTGCSGLNAKPSSAVFELSNPVAGETTDLKTTVDFPATTLATRNGTIAETTVTLPPTVSPHFSGFGPASGMCPGTSAAIRLPSVATPSSQPFFRSPSIVWAGGSASANCPVQSRIGVAKVWTPLLKDPVIGYVWAVSKAPVPDIAIDVNPTIPGNPKGVNLTLIGESQLLNDGNAIDGIGKSLIIKFGKTPDAPVTKLEVDINEAPVAVGGTREMLTIAAPDDPSCQPEVDFGLSITGQAGSSNQAVGTDSVTGCDPNPVTVTGPVGQTTSNTSPSFQVTNGQTYGFCRFLPVPTALVNCPAGTTSVSPPAALGNGFHSLQISNSNTTPLTTIDDSPPDRRNVYRYFAVDTTAPGDTTPPNTSITGPSDPTSDTTPTYSFSSPESVLFECALDAEAFVPCGSGSAATTGSTTVASPIVVNDDAHTVSVRARDAAGNVDATPATATFHVDVAFDPTFDVALSTTQARAHPTLDVTITSGSHEDMKDLKLDLPNGFLGGLSSVVTQCDKDVAADGGCTSASKVGTVEVAAAVDESIIRLPGTVYMTTELVDGDPAGLSIDVPAVIQSVDQGHITVPIRLTVRGQVEGINSTATNLPVGITPTNGFDGPTNFDLRSVTLKLRDNPAASQPLLTNPSQCGASAFAASFTGSDLPTPTTVSKSVAFQATNCGALAFAPQLGINITDLNGNPPQSPLDTTSNVMRVTAHLAANPNDAGIKTIDLLFPKPVTINLSKLPTPCTAEQYAAGGIGACPASANIGSVSANSPLLREPLKGNVYIVKAAGRTIPNLVVALRGKINTDIIGRNEFVNNSQIHTTFDTTPDVPLNSFDLDISNLITARDEVCETNQTQWNVTGTMLAYNGSASAVVNPLNFNCKAVGSARFKNKGKKSTLTLSVKAPGGSKLKSVSVKFPKGLKLTKKGLKKKASFKGGTNTGGSFKLKAKCFKYSGTNKYSVNFCKKPAYLITTKFAAGSIEATKKVKKPKFTIQTVDALGRKTSYTIQAK